MRKNLLLTFWLLLPIAVVSLLVWWVFASLGRPRAMDAPPVGAGAGDAGGANAVGEWLAHRDDVDPQAWPGGVELLFPEAAVGDAPGGVTIVSLGEGSAMARSWVPQLRGGWYVLRLSHEEAARFGTFVVVAGGAATVEGTGDLARATDAEGRPLRAFTLPPTPPGRTPRSEPLPVRIEAESNLGVEP